MNVWCHLPTIINRRTALRIVGLLSLCVALTTTLLFSTLTHAAPGVNQTLSFEGRLTTSGGSVVPDGYYNIQFKIYQDGTGTTAGNTNGTLDWTESYINNGGTSGVKVTNGFFSVNLGSVNPFGTSVDWNDDTLWLSMNIAGTASACTTFNTSPCSADGEMLPMKRITSTPYAINSGLLGGKAADNFVQLAQGVQTDATSNTSSIFINKTSSGNLVQLQNASADIFTVGNAGDLTLGNNADKTISLATADAGNAGNSLTIAAGHGGSGAGSAGGDLVLQGGDAGGSTADGGNVQIDAGAGTGAGTGGTISIGSANANAITIGSTSTAANQTISVGTNNTAGSTTNVTIGASGSAAGGTTSVQSKDDTTITTDGTQRARFSGAGDTLYLGNADASGTASTANSFTIQGTTSTGSGVQGGSINLQSGSATSGDANGGTLTLSGGSGSGSGAAGLVVISTPTFQAASQQSFSSNGSVTQANIDGNGVLNLKATATGLTVTMGDPTLTTAGRIVYVTASSDSDDFTLSLNGGTHLLVIHPSTTATLLWNGSDWTVAGSSSSLNLQDSDTTSLFSATTNAGAASNVQIGTGTGTGTPTVLTLDKSASSPTVTGDAMLGSMYYDTAKGQVQCYEASGWGSCTAAPDDFVSISPEYTNAVVHPTGTGTLTSDLCSDTLNINNGTSGQPSVCSTNETFNYYDWTSTEVTGQTRSIYVTYQLPSTFKGFVAGATSLMAKTDSSDASASYQVYRNNASTGLTACGSAVSVSTGTQTTWQKGTATSTADPSTCGFVAGDSIVFRVDLTAANTANAYASTLDFAYSNN
jgi:hypothetical protein